MTEYSSLWRLVYSSSGSPGVSFLDPEAGPGFPSDTNIVVVVVLGVAVMRFSKY